MMGQGFLEAPAEIWFSQAKLLLELVGVLWVIAIIDIGCLDYALLKAVVQRPRTWAGLLYYPFLSGLFHVGWDHLTGNSLYALLFGGMIVFRDPTQLGMVTIVTALLSGLGVWLVGRGPSCGSSGIIFGYLGFIIANAVLEKDFLSAILLTWLIFTFLFGSQMFYHSGNWDEDSYSSIIHRVVWNAGKTLWGIVPGDNDRISWEAHLMGLLSGVFAAQHKGILTPWVNQLIYWIQSS